MEDFLKRWLFDPTVGKLIVTGITLAIVYVVVRSLQRGIGRYVQDTDTRYRARKFVSFLGYTVAIVIPRMKLMHNEKKISLTYIARAGPREVRKDSIRRATKL